MNEVKMKTYPLRALGFSYTLARKDEEKMRISGFGINCPNCGRHIQQEGCLPRECFHCGAVFIYKVEVYHRRKSNDDYNR